MLEYLKYTTLDKAPLRPIHHSVKVNLANYILYIIRKEYRQCFTILKI